MNTKTLTEFKMTDAGHVEAVFSTLNVKDLDGDVTLPGAFDDGAPILISAYGHSSWGSAPPVGRGKIRMDGDRAILDGQFFMDTSAGKDTFLTVKGMAELGQWSYGYDVLESESGQHQGEDVRFLKKLKVHEASPVLIGAGINTQTLATKDPFSEQADKVIADFTALLARAKAFGSQGETEHSGLSAANRDRLVKLAEALGVAGEELTVLITVPDPNKGDDAIRAIVMAEAARFQHTLTGRNGNEHSPAGAARAA